MWIQDYNGLVFTMGTVMRTPKPTDKKVLVILDMLGDKWDVGRNGYAAPCSKLPGSHPPRREIPVFTLEDVRREYHRLDGICGVDTSQNFQ